MKVHPRSDGVFLNSLKEGQTVPKSDQIKRIQLNFKFGKNVNTPRKTGFWVVLTGMCKKDRNFSKLKFGYKLVSWYKAFQISDEKSDKIGV